MQKFNVKIEKKDNEYFLEGEAFGEEIDQEKHINK